MTTEKRFVIKCPCGWNRLSSGLSDDLEDLVEITNCGTCGKLRTFRCPKCSQKAKQFRIKGNIE